MLASQVVQHLRDTAKDQKKLILALFFDIKDPALQNMESLLGSLVKQCVQNSAGGVRSSKLMEMFSDSSSERKPNEEDLIEVLKDEFDGAAQVYLVLDNWDGILQDIRSQFERTVQDLVGNGPKICTLVFARSSEEDSTRRTFWCHKCGAPNLKIFYYCKPRSDEGRPCPDMEFCKDCYSKGETCGVSSHEMVTPDRVHILVKPEDEQIRRYVEWDMSRAIADPSRRRRHPRAESLSLSGISLDRMLAEKPAMRTEIPKIVAIKSNSSFQVAKLHIATIKDMPTVQAIEDSLEKEAQGLREIYKERIEQLSSLEPREKREALMTSLYWIANCRQLLSFPALQHAVAIKPHAANIDNRNMLRKEGLILDSSGIIIINKEGEVRIDMTMREWLEENPGDWFDGQDVQMALKLLTYLSLDDCRQPWGDEDEEALERTLRWMPLLEYASQYWAEHVTPYCADKRVKLELLKFLTRKESIDSCLRVAYKTSSKLFVDLDIRKGANGLHLAAFHGLEEAVLDLIEDKNIDINDVDEKYGQTALMYAARKGHAVIVDMLLNNGAKVDIWSLRGGHALFDAYLGDQNDDSTNSKITKTILQRADSQVDLRYPRKGNRTLLMLASYRGDLDMVCRILGRHKNFSINAQDNRGYTALMLAIEQIQLAVVEFLLKDFRVKIDLRQETGESAIDLAVKTQSSTLVRMMFADRPSLLQNSDQIHLTFFKVVEQGDANMVRMLREQKVPVNGLDKNRRTLLHAAASQDNPNVVQLLIDFGLDKNAQADNGATPLHEASRQGNLQTVRTLLKMNVDRAIEETGLVGHLSWWLVKMRR